VILIGLSEFQPVSKNATIRRLEITCFRGIQSFVWNPASGMNLVLGGGDVGKTTLLEAIAFLLSPSNAVTISESDYWRRDNTKEFIIEAVMSLPEASEIGTQQNFAWPWAWDGTKAVLPVANKDDDIPKPTDPVYRVRVRGTTDLELVWEIVQPHDVMDHFSVAVRRKIGLLRLSADERNDRDLRLVYGSALDRLLSDVALRARIGKRVSELDLDQSLSEKGAQAITALDERMAAAALPHDLKLGLTTSQGLSIGALIGLLAKKDDVNLPLGSWGAGTRRMAALEIGSSTEKEASVTIIDEIERGLEPYRLRKLIKILHAGAGQTFITTHNPVAISCAGQAHLWYLDAAGAIGALPYDKIEQQQRRDPETFLAKVAVIAEGPTEVGFLSILLEKAFGSDPLDYGIRVCDGQGNSSTLALLETLSSAGLIFAGLVDDEGTESGRWQKLKENFGEKLHQWSQGCTEQHVIGAIAEANLWDLLKDEDGDLDGHRLRTLADRLGLCDKQPKSIEEELTNQGKTLRQLIIDASTGSKIDAPAGREREWKAHSRSWFKSEMGGRELANKMATLGAWPTIGPVILPLINAIRAAVDQPHLQRIEL
jgi:putative ATP-dependent endonuclease of OLD family